MKLPASIQRHLIEYAFSSPTIPTKEEISGWCTLLDDGVFDSDFSDHNMWRLADGSSVVFGLRVERRIIPPRYFKIELARRVKKWRLDRDVEKCPKAVRAELKQNLEDELFKRALPDVKIIEIAWLTNEDLVYVATHSERVCDQIRKRFLRSFGGRLMPSSPLEWVDKKTSSKLLSLPPSAV